MMMTIAQHFFVGLLSAALGTFFALWAVSRDRAKFENELRFAVMREAEQNERKIARIEQHLGLEPLVPTIFDKLRAVNAMDPPE